MFIHANTVEVTARSLPTLHGLLRDVFGRFSVCRHIGARCGTPDRVSVDLSPTTFGIPWSFRQAGAIVSRPLTVGPLERAGGMIGYWNPYFASKDDFFRTASDCASLLRAAAGNDPISEVRQLSLLSQERPITRDGGDIPYRAVAGYYQDVLCLLFPGTYTPKTFDVRLASHSMEAWARNILPVLLPFDPKLAPGAGRAHEGFESALDQIWESVLLNLKQYERYLESLGGSSRSAAEVILSGNSLGGAMAILAAKRIAEGRPSARLPRLRVKGVFVFGCPRVGNYQFSRTYPVADRLHRFEAFGDIITVLPASPDQPREWVDFAVRNGLRDSLVFCGDFHPVGNQHLLGESGGHDFVPYDDLRSQYRERYFPDIIDRLFNCFEHHRISYYEKLINSVRGGGMTLRPGGRADG